MATRDRLARYFPAFALEVRTPRLVLRYPDDDDVADLADLAAQGVHDPGVMPFTTPWTRAESPDLERNSHLFLWRQRALLLAQGWQLPMAVVVDGVVVGVQALFTAGWEPTRTFETGSWLGRAHQGRGIGTEMRAAALHLGFEGLGALRAETAAWHDNTASIGVTERVGYRPNGSRLADREGVPDRLVDYCMERDDWLATRRDDIVLVGAEAVRASLGSERPVGRAPGS